MTGDSRSIRRSVSKRHYSFSKLLAGTEYVVCVSALDAWRRHLATTCRPASTAGESVSESSGLEIGLGLALLTLVCVGVAVVAVVYYRRKWLGEDKDVADTSRDWLELRRPESVARYTVDPGLASSGTTAAASSAVASDPPGQGYCNRATTAFSKDVSSAINMHVTHAPLYLCRALSAQI